MDPPIFSVDKWTEKEKSSIIVSPIHSLATPLFGAPLALLHTPLPRLRHHRRRRIRWLARVRSLFGDVERMEYRGAHDDDSNASPSIPVEQPPYRSVSHDSRHWLRPHRRRAEHPRTQSVRHSPHEQARTRRSVPGADAGGNDGGNDRSLWRSAPPPSRRGHGRSERGNLPPGDVTRCPHS